MNAISLDIYREVRKGRIARNKPRTFTEQEKKQIHKGMQKGYMKMLVNFSQ